MSGVWGGWMRRLRRGEPAAPESAPSRRSDRPAEPAPAHDEGPRSVEPDKSDGWPDERLEEGEPDEGWPHEGAADDDLLPSPVASRSRISPAAPPPPPVPVRQLLQRGDLAACRVALESGADTGLGSLVAALTEGEAILRGVRVDVAENGVSVMLAPARGSSALLVVFGEDGGGFALPPPPDAAVHTLYLRDSGRCLGMLGIEALGGDYDACLLGVLRIARALGADNIFCLGAGAACYSALRYGLDLGAAGVLAAGSLDHVRRGVQAPGLRPGTRAQRLMRLAAELGADMTIAYAGAALRPGLVLCRPGQSALAGLAELPGTIGIDAPPGAAPRMLDWAEQSGLWRGMIGDLLTRRPVG